MAKFMYQARSAQGRIQTGQMEAYDENELKIKLQSQSLTLLKSISSGPAAAPKKAVVAGGGMKISGRPSTKEMQIFTRQFSTLINAGIPVVDSLKILGEGKRNETLKEAANRVRQSIEGGKKLSEAMAVHAHIFDKFYINMVHAGEEAGILDGILMRLSTYMEKAEKIKKQVTGALMYPLIIIIVAALVISGILVFVIPKFQEMYSAAGQSLPAITQLVVVMSNFLIHRWYIVIGILIAGPWAFFAWIKTEEGKNVFDSILIKVPVFGELVQKSAIAKMSRTLSTLLSSGVGVVEALDIAAKTSGNKIIENALRKSKDAVMSGKQLSGPLSKEPMIPDMVTQMIAIGEQSGTMDVMLGKIADFYEDDVENVVKAVTSMIEPLMMVFLGGIIAFLVIAMYAPIFNMANVAAG